MSKRHCDVVERVIKYLDGTRTEGLTLDRKKGLDVTLYADSDFARDKSDRCPVTGAAMTCAGTAMSWFFRTQRCLATSSMEAEYAAMSDGVKEAVVIQQLDPKRYR